MIIANPPYNAGQINENDNNKNRKYPEIDRRVRVTYSADSEATLVRKLSDPYVKAIRFASDRIGSAGVVCYVNNDSFVAEKTFDGMRKHLARDFDLIYVLELGGNVRKNPKLSGTTHNVFGIQVGVSINLFIRLARDKNERRSAKILYHAVPIDWRRKQKYDFLDHVSSIVGIKWRTLKPDSKHNWLTSKSDSEFAELLPMGSKIAKAHKGSGDAVIFRLYSLGVATNRDEWVYGFSETEVSRKTRMLMKNYNSEVIRYEADGKPDPKEIDDWVNNDPSFVKWTDRLKNRTYRRPKVEVR